MPLPSNLIGKINKGPDPNPAPPTPVVAEQMPIAGDVGTRCRVCAHKQRSEIEERYLVTTPTAIARWLGENGHAPIPVSTIKKHFDQCIAGEILLSKNAQTSAQRFVGRIDKLVCRMEGYLDEFDDQGEGEDGIKPPKDWKGLAAIANQLRAAIELLGKASGHLGPDNVINIIESPQFITVATNIAQVTVRCPNCGPVVKTILTENSE